MDDTHGSRRPAARSPRRSGSASDQLGELRFSDWYDTPVFEPDEDELVEELATSGSGPRRFMARARLSREAHRAKRRPEWDAAPQAPAPAPAATTKPAPIPRAKAAPEPPAPKPIPAAAAKAKAKPAPAPEPTPDLDAWVTSGPALTDESMQLDLSRESSWRRRIDSFLDRWAQREVAVAARLDRSLERVLNPSLPEFIASVAKRGASR